MMDERPPCQLNPLGMENPTHSDDLIEVHHGSTTPAYVCGYHLTHWPELVGKS